MIYRNHPRRPVAFFLEKSVNNLPVKFITLEEKTIMETKKTKAQIRQELKRYFGKTTFRLSFVHSSQYAVAEVIYHDFRVMDDVNRDLSELIGEGWNVDARCGISDADYIAGLIRLIENGYSRRAAKKGSSVYNTMDLSKFLFDIREKCEEEWKYIRETIREI